MSQNLSQILLPLEPKWEADLKLSSCYLNYQKQWFLRTDGQKLSTSPLAPFYVFPQWALCPCKHLVLSD